MASVYRLRLHRRAGSHQPVRTPSGLPGTGARQPAPPRQALGTATLPWKFNYEAASIVGSATAVDQGAQVWVQATADLPVPISYSWAVDGVGKPWTGSFVTTSFSQQGWTAVSATMTGANGAHVTRQWNFLVTSGCPNGEIFC